MYAASAVYSVCSISPDLSKRVLIFRHQYLMSYHIFCLLREFQNSPVSSGSLNGQMHVIGLSPVNYISVPFVYHKLMAFGFEDNNLLYPDLSEKNHHIQEISFHFRFILWLPDFGWGLKISWNYNCFPDGRN